MHSSPLIVFEGAMLVPIPYRDTKLGKCIAEKIHASNVTNREIAEALKNGSIVTQLLSGRA
ncbi:hypothetical protein GCM10007874_44850 [Labrys miyagiensis]|uniref:Uncharacterized protein n=1 Tax=Labrys miyagiensis TaxID=346912 RepID=A0ABQ6CMC7_9HYPH|nr:hypothetical protein GCM10007874_44850 [Labrys miyagiensis]